MSHSGGQGELLKMLFSDDFGPLQKTLREQVAKAAEQLSKAAADGKDGASQWAVVDGDQLQAAHVLLVAI